MANELTPPTEPLPTTNGQPARNGTTSPGKAETTLQRAARVLAGDIRAEDYLPVPDNVVPFVADAEASGGVPMLPEARQTMILDLALQHYHAGNIVLCWFVPEGVIVLAVGTAEVDSVLENLSLDKQAMTKIQYPATLLDCLDLVVATFLE